MLLLLAPIGLNFPVHDGSYCAGKVMLSLPISPADMLNPTMFIQHQNLLTYSAHSNKPIGLINNWVFWKWTGELFWLFNSIGARPGHEITEGESLCHAKVS